jgi:hypothetical protein
MLQKGLCGSPAICINGEKAILLSVAQEPLAMAIVEIIMKVSNLPKVR